MTLYMDRHDLPGATAMDLAAAHMKDLDVGEPVTENDDLFGSAVQLAARLCSTAQTGGILVSGAVRELSLGKGFVFEDRGTVELKGFDEPVRAFEVRWA